MKEAVSATDKKRTSAAKNALEDENKELKKQIASLGARLEASAKQREAEAKLALEGQERIIATFRAREEHKHFLYIQQLRLSGEYKAQVEYLEKANDNWAKEVLSRGKVRARHDVHYSVLRDFIFSNHPVDVATLEKIVDAYPTLAPHKIVQVMEEFGLKIGYVELEKLRKKYGKQVETWLAGFEGGPELINVSEDIKKAREEIEERISFESARDIAAKVDMEVKDIFAKSLDGSKWNLKTGSKVR